MNERLSHELLALRVAAELRRGQVVNLGIGLPTLVADCLPADRGVVLHTENGVLGYGPHATTEEKDPALINARGEPITLFPGAAILSHNDSFGIVRGGYLDVAVLGALQVSEKGDLASWMVPGRGLGSPGGAVDIATAAKRLIVMTEHTTGDYAPKVLKECAYPLTGRGCVDLIITDLAVIEVTPQGLVLTELSPGSTADTVQGLTEAPLRLSPRLKTMDFAQPEDPPLSKVFPSAAAAVADIPDGAVVLIDGFGGSGGMAHYLMMALRDQGARNLTMVSNTAGIARVSNFGAPRGLRAIDHSILVENGQIKKAIASFPVSPSPSRPTAFEEAYRKGGVELELSPQGTLAERIRAGAYGVAAFYTPTGAGTLVSEGKEQRLINGKMHVLETAIKADFALLRAYKADALGNLVFKGTSRNFNAVLAGAATVTIAEVDEIVEPGKLDPEAIVTPGVFVQRIVKRPDDFSPYEALS